MLSKPSAVLFVVAALCSTVLGWGPLPTAQEVLRRRLLIKVNKEGVIIDANVGDLVLRKGKLCTVTKVDRSTSPPSVIVKMFEDGQEEVGTELHLLSTFLDQNPTSAIPGAGRNDAMSTLASAVPKRKASPGAKDLLDPNMIPNAFGARQMSQRPQSTPGKPLNRKPKTKAPVGLFSGLSPFAS